MKFNAFCFKLTTLIGLSLLLLFIKQVPVYKHPIWNIFRVTQPMVNQNWINTLDNVRIVTPVQRMYQEQAREIAFKMRYFPQTVGVTKDVKIIYMATKFFHYSGWRSFYNLQMGSQSFHRYNCPVSNCTVTTDKKLRFKAHAHIYHLRDLRSIETLIGGRSSQQIYILYSMEPPWLEIVNLKRLEGFFNWTMSYREDADIVVKYGFIGKRLNGSREAKHNLGLIQKITSNKTSMVVWFVSNCCSESGREKFVLELQKHLQVDIIGGCGNKTKCFPVDSAKCYEQVAHKYFFYLAFENAICKDYVTEKFFNPMDADIVPVVLGGANYSGFAPLGSFINALDFKSPGALANHLKTVASNTALYQSYFQWKEFGRSYLQAWPCELCRKLHQDYEVHSRINLDKWWNQNADCKSWEENQLRPVKRLHLPCYNN